MKTVRLKVMRSRCQRGAVAIMFGLTLVVLIGFAGLAIDLGRFFVIKTELQNGMDACALSAASQLKPGASDPNVFTRAEAYGKVFFKTDVDNAVKNKVNFQSMVPNPDLLQITFANSNDGPFNVTDANVAKFVKCQYPLTDLPIYFMQVLNPLLTTQTVSAMAVATRDIPLASCLPVAVCSDPGSGAGTNFGYTVGQWATAIDGSSYGTGNFGWAGLTTPGSSNQLKDALTGSSQCDISNPSQLVYGSGLKAGLTKEWNSRFGVYAPSMNPNDAPPDHTGYAYSDAPGGNWLPVPPATQGFNVYSGTNSLNPSTPNFGTAVANNLRYDSASPQPPDFPVSQYTVLSSDELVALGRNNRRVVVTPIVDCSAWNTTPPEDKNLPVQGWACVLMLNPYDESGPPTAPRRKAKLEFLGLASDPLSPCAAGSTFAFAPVLTQ
ncbi:TadE/TadG family type IV pilus assembly protein [Rhodoferax sp.]|uniref:TadE/TadG family type IV pilus assembly protein n=1 Tax=Rhodoferax sp. TaxID=50421 RepID=UPI002604F7CF|nr:TadE/TadG family type IV pilus assembly protein [Rhodoferax sp.]MDD3935570.1 Tad domain-containing protein [Rhodoferax sp.]